MAQYYTDFSEYTTGQHPAGWTQRRDEATSWSVEADAGATGGKVLRFPGKAANTQSILTWDAIDSDSGRADVEILIRFRYGGTSASLYAWARDASTSSAATGYRCGDSYTGTTIGIIGKYVSGSYTNIYTAGAGAINATNTWAYIRAQISGNSLRVRVWKAGDPEPDTWRGTGTDNSLSTGRVGIMIFNTAPVDIDWIGIGTGGDPAPDSPVDPGGAVYNDTIAESVAAADSVAAVAAWAADLTESAALADSYASVMAMAAALSEMATLADAYAAVVDGGGQTYDESVSDALAAADGYGASASFAAALGEALEAVAGYAAGNQVAVAISEAVTVGDSIAHAVTWGATITDALAAADAYATQAAFSGSLTEALSSVDSFTASGGESLLWLVRGRASTDWAERDEDAGSWSVVNPSPATWTEQ